MRLFRHPDSVFKSEDNFNHGTTPEPENKSHETKNTYYYKNSKNDTSFEDLFGGASDRKTDNSKTSHKDATNDFNAEDYIKQEPNKFHEGKYYSESDSKFIIFK